MSMSSMCLSLRSSRMNEASVASEIDYNRENASQSTEQLDYSTTNDMSQVDEAPCQNSSLNNHFGMLDIKREIKTMDRMTMDDGAF